MKTIDKTRRVTEVGGRAPLRYLQDGYGFDASGKCLGGFTDSGEPEAAKKEAPVTESAFQTADTVAEPAIPEAAKPRRGRKPKAQDEAGA